MGREAARLLVEQLEGDAVVQHLVLPVELVVRDSTSQPAGQRGTARPPDGGSLLLSGTTVRNRLGGPSQRDGCIMML